jgi:hypothetical protein
MAGEHRKNALHLIRDVLASATARGTLGNLSQQDLKVLADHQTKGTLILEIDPILSDPNPMQKAEKTKSDVAEVFAKLPENNLNALSKHWAKRGIVCK